MESNVDAVFSELNSMYKEVDKVVECIRERRDKFDLTFRSVQRATAAFHTVSDIREACAPVRTQLLNTGVPLAEIQKGIPNVNGDSFSGLFSFHRYSDMWANQRQSVCSVAVLVEFLEHGTLPSKDGVLKLLGSEFTLPMEDYLVGVCNAVSDMVRICTNRVIRNDYKTPARCAVFASQIFDAFKELNFRNDFLRKRFDGMKYDVKRLEEIVYDLSVRGLLQKIELDDVNKRRTNDMDTA